MKCVIPGINIKIFGRAVHSLAKIGEELYVEPGASGIDFRALNSSRSAFACFHFGSGFFSHYDNGASVAAGDQANSEESVRCKVSMKAFLNAFKSLAALERNVDKCKLILDSEEDKLAVQFTCRYGIIKTYNMPFIECETVQAVFDRNACCNCIESQSKVLSDAVVNFQSNQEEITLSVAAEKTIIRNYVDDEPDPAKAIHTVLTMEAGEFDGYDIASECEVTFCLKELRAVLGFTEPVNLPITLNFSTPGSPMILVCHNSPMFEVTFVLATLSQNTDSQVSRSSNVGKAASQATHRQGTSSSYRTSENNNNKTLLSESQYPGLSASSRKSEQISRVGSQLIEPGALSANCSIHNGSMSGRMSPPPDHSLPNVDCNDSLVEEEVRDVVPTLSSQEKAKAAEKRKLFRVCYSSTFDPNDITGFCNVYADASDSE